MTDETTTLTSTPTGPHRRISSHRPDGRARRRHRARSLAVAALAALLAGSLLGCASEGSAGGTGSAVVTTPTDGRSADTRGAGTGPEIVAGTATLRPVLVFHRDGSVAPSGAVPGLDGEAYELGSPLPDGVVESAQVALNSAGDWAVALVLADGSPGIDDLNALAADCDARAAACPTGQLAVVLGDEVVSAPILMGGPFEADEIQITGLDEAQARQLAAALG